MYPQNMHMAEAAQSSEGWGPRGYGCTWPPLLYPEPRRRFPARASLAFLTCRFPAFPLSCVTSSCTLRPGRRRRWDVRERLDAACVDWNGTVQPCCTLFGQDTPLSFCAESQVLGLAGSRQRPSRHGPRPHRYLQDRRLRDHKPVCPKRSPISGSAESNEVFLPEPRIEALIFNRLSGQTKPSNHVARTKDGRSGTVRLWVRTWRGSAARTRCGQPGPFPPGPRTGY